MVVTVMNAATVPAPPLAPAVLRRPRGRPRKTLDERDDGNRRRELINAAARLFRRQGFAATSTRDIASAVGMQSGSPFYHFKSKGALLYAVMDEGMRSAIERQQQALDHALQRHERPAALLRELIRSHFEILLGPQSDFIPVMLYEWRSLNARQRQAIARLKDQYEAAWVPLLQALKDAGLLRAEVHLARLLIFGAMNWSASWFDAKKAASLDELTAAAMDLFVPQEQSR
jgi:AcrR family transcriptional regulator